MQIRSCKFRCFAGILFSFSAILQIHGQPVVIGSGVGSMAEMPEVLVGPMFVEGAGYSSRITLVNELNFSVTADVILSDLAGARIGSQTVVFGPHSERDVAVSDVLRAAGSTAAVGTVAVLPDPAKVVTMAIAAQISINGSGAAAGQHIEEELSMPSAGGAGVLRAAGSAIEGVVEVAIHNSASSPQTATVTCLLERGGATGSAVTIAPLGAALVRACSPGPGAGGLEAALLPPASPADAGSFGISVTGDGKPGTLSAFGFAWSGGGFRPQMTSLNFVDAGLARSANTIFTGVPVGASALMPGSVFTPRLAVVNFGSAAVKASVTFARTDDGGPEVNSVAAITIPAMSARTVDLPELTGDPGLRNSFVVRSDGAPGTVIANLVSTSPSGFGIVEQIGKDEKIEANAGGHPWDLSGGKDAVLLLFNQSASPKTFNVKVGHDGVLWWRALQLAPMETRSVSIRELIADRVKDLNGAVIPAGLESGEVSWFTPNIGEGKGRLMEIDGGTQTVARVARVARNFSCGYNLVLCGAYLQVDAISFGYDEISDPLQLGPVIPEICQAFNPNACSGQSYGSGGSGYIYNWQANDPAVATIYGPASGSTGAFFGAGVGAGSATGFIDSATCGYGAGGSVTVKCSYPSGDSTAFYGWDDAGGDGSLGEWVQTLSPALSSPATWAGRTVTESNGPPATDSCWFATSKIPKVTGVGPSVPWPVSAQGQWGPDYVGWLPDAVLFYQNQRPKLELPLPCEFDMFQNLTITCPACASEVYRVNVPLRGIISGTGVSSGRDGQLQGRAYQIQ